MERSLFRRMSREYEKSQETLERRKTREQAKKPAKQLIESQRLPAEKERRREIAQVERVDTAILTTLSLLESTRDQDSRYNIFQVRCATPVVVDKIGRGKTTDSASLIAVSLGMSIKRPDKYHGDAIRDLDISTLRRKTQEERLKGVNCIGAYVFKLPFRDELSLGDTVVGLVGEPIGEEYAHPYAVSDFINNVDVSRLINYRRRRDYEKGPRNGETNTYLAIVDAVSDVLPPQEVI